MARCLSDAIKRASQDANEAGKPCDLRFGTVVSVSPLKVKITDTFTLPQSLLVVPKSLTNYMTQITIDGVTKNITVYNELKVNDKVALVRQHGGRSYLIVDKI